VCVCVCVCVGVCVCVCVCVRARARACRDGDQSALLAEIVYCWSIWDIDRTERGGKVRFLCSHM
jgi:hypothetical protein